MMNGCRRFAGLSFPVLSAGLLLLCLDASSASAESNWPQFRGPDGQGHSTDYQLPTTWNEQQNVVWKVPVLGRGYSSPVVSDGKVWLTTCFAVDQSLRVLCFDCEDGELLLSVPVFQEPLLGVIHPRNSHATPTPILDEHRVYVHFGAHGTACLSTDGEILWTAALDYYHHHGPAASPVRVDDLLIVPCDGFVRPFYDQIDRPDVRDFQYVAALDARTGGLRWKRAREGRHAYATPLVVDFDGRQQVISPGGDCITAFDPTTGEELWWCRHSGYSLVPRPVCGNGLVFVCTGFDHPALLAIRPDGQGDVTDTHVVWSTKKGVPLTASPLLVDDQLYLVNDAGILTCLDADTGELQWRQRLLGNFSASPVWTDGRIYIPNESGLTYVISDNPEHKSLARNKLHGQIFASFAVSDAAFYIRTDRFLYRIEEENTELGDPVRTSSMSQRTRIETRVDVQLDRLDETSSAEIGPVMSETTPRQTRDDPGWLVGVRLKREGNHPVRKRRDVAKRNPF